MGVGALIEEPRPVSLDLQKAENEGFPMRYMTSLYLKYFLRKLPKTVEICLKKSRLPGYFFVGVYIITFWDGRVKLFSLGFYYIIWDTLCLICPVCPICYCPGVQLSFVHYVKCD